MLWQRSLSTVTFATSCWEKDWKTILLQDDYLKRLQIENQSYPFDRKILIINNVNDLERVKEAAEKKRQEKVIDDYFVAQDKESEIFSFFHLSKSDFVSKDWPQNWLYYNALAPLAALYFSDTDYLLYLTGDVFLPHKVDWIQPSIRMLKKNLSYKVANLVWNENYKEVKKESYRKKGPFYISKEGFSDQMFFVKLSDFKKPIYNEIREDASHFPRGNVWEKRLFSYMKNHNWERITYRWGSYTHQNINE